MKIYIAAPLFNLAEKRFNLEVDAALRAAGYDTYLPQRDGGEAAPLVRQGFDEDTVRRRLFAADVTAVRTCDALVFVLDGRVPDEGGCVELGMAYAWNKPCFALQTDCRRFGGTDSNNLMIDYAVDRQAAHTIDDMISLLQHHLPTAAPIGHGVAQTTP